MPTHNVQLEDWGLIDYQLALDRQLEFLENVATKKSKGYLVFCTHPPVVTLGRKTQAGDVFAWQGQTIEVARGGRATYHGPNQLVIYPILEVRDVHKFLRNLENSIVLTLEHYGVSASGRSSENNLEDTGVWVSGKKIASLGVGIRKWISFHGAAINLHKDLKAFQGLHPCGYESNVMTSLEEITGIKIEAENFKNLFIENFNKVFID